MRFITSRGIVFVTLAGEMAVAISLGIYFVLNVLGNLAFRNSISIVIVIGCLILWTLNYFIYGKYPIALRVFIPFLFTPIVLTQSATTLQVLISIFILSIIVITDLPNKSATHS